MRNSDSAAAILRQLNSKTKKRKLLKENRWVPRKVFVILPLYDSNRFRIRTQVFLKSTDTHRRRRATGRNNGKKPKPVIINIIIVNTKNIPLKDFLIYENMPALDAILTNGSHMKQTLLIRKEWRPDE
jgi:hypothetical protein